MASDFAALIVGLIAFFVVFLVCVVIFTIIRQFVLWYWRINEMADNLAYIANYLRESNADENLAFLANIKRRELREKAASAPDTGHYAP